MCHFFVRLQQKVPKFLNFRHFPYSELEQICLKSFCSRLLPRSFWVKRMEILGSKNASYVKLQDAFVAEKGIRVGNWKEIGYLMKNSSNFYYCDLASGNCAAASNSDGYAAKGTIADNNYVANWQATNIATLNDCAANNNWKLTTSQNSTSGGEVLYAASVTTDCGILTPSFEKLQTAATQSGTP